MLQVSAAMNVKRSLSLTVIACNDAMLQVSAATSVRRSLTAVTLTTASTVTARGCVTALCSASMSILLTIQLASEVSDVIVRVISPCASKCHRRKLHSCNRCYILVKRSKRYVTSI